MGKAKMNPTSESGKPKPSSTIEKTDKLNTPIIPTNPAESSPKMHLVLVKKVFIVIFCNAILSFIKA